MGSGGEQRVVIVGGGPAAKAAAGAYRRAEGRGPVTILAGEPELPYERPPLSKEFLRGEIGRAALALQAVGWFDELEVEVVAATRVEELDLPRGRALSADGRAWEFDRCLLATGSRPALPPVPGVEGPGVHRIRTIADSEALAELAGSRLLVIGSGFIGCEAAASMAMRGADVTVAALESRPQVERLGAEASERIAGWLRGYGVTIIGEAELAALAGAPGRLTASFADGRELRADAVLLALGIVRNDELAAAAGVETDDGVLVDDSMVSSDPRLLAAGDVARAANAAAGRRLAVEHWGEAIKHGEVAGATLAGAEAHWGSAPGFWSTIGERTLKFAGWGQGWDELRFESHGDDFTAWYGHEGELAGVLTYQRDHDYELGREAIERRTGWS